MKDTAPIGLGILAVAAVFGLIAGGVALVLFEFAFIAAALIAILVALIVMLVLWLGWRDPAPTLQESNAAGRAEIEARRTAGAPSPAEAKDTAASEEAAADNKAAETAAAKAAADAKAAAEAKAAADAKTAADAKAAAAASAAESGDKDYDGDGVVEGENEGTRPAALDGPRDGKADNLKEIKGIGPKMEKMCNSLGFYHFDQIANWTADEVAWVDANLEGFKGRVTRDTWVEQAKILAAGGETAFSKKVEDGGVY